MGCGIDVVEGGVGGDACGSTCEGREGERGTIERDLVEDGKARVVTNMPGAFESTDELYADVDADADTNADPSTRLQYLLVNGGGIQLSVQDRGT